MSNIFILKKDIYFKNKKIKFDNPLFFGYWNSLNPEYGGIDLLNDILNIKLTNIKKLLERINLNEFDHLIDFINEGRINHQIIYGSCMFSYAFVAIRINIQFNYLKT